MKKFSKFLIVFIIGLVGFATVPEGKADAAWSAWQSRDGFKAGCKVRVWVDAYSYSNAANTVDAKAEQNGSCGTIYYQMFLSSDGSDSVGASDDLFTGNFNSSTPVKSFNINTVKVNWTQNAVVYLYMYKTSNISGAWNTKVASHGITIAPQ